MPFDNFYLESDQISRRRWVFIFFFFVALFGYIFLWFIGAFNIESSVTRQDEERFARVDKLCSDLPKPERIFFLHKRTLVRHKFAKSAHLFVSDRSTDEIKSFYLILLPSEGWTFDSKSGFNFYKEGQIITINDYDYTASSDFAIECSESFQKK